MNNTSYCEENNNSKKVFDIQKCPKTISELLFKKAENHVPNQHIKVAPDNTINNQFTRPFDTLTLAERMKLKKEKAKMLLERKRDKKEEETFTANESQLNDNMSSYSLEGTI